MAGIPMSALDKARQQRAANRENSTANTSPVWIMPDELDVTIQFLTDPLDRDGWFLFREAYCAEFKHVSGVWLDGPYEGRERAEIPFAMRDVPVEDVRVDDARGLRYDKPDVVDINGQPMELLSDVLDGSSLDWADKNGNPKAQWKIMFNVVVHDWQDSTNAKGDPRRHPQPGDHILMKFRERDWALIASTLRSRHDDEEIDVVASKWKIHITKANKKISQDRMVTVSRKGNAEPIAVDLFDPETEYQAMRESFLNLASAVHADFIGAGEQTVVVHDSAPSSVPTLADPNMMSTAGLRAKLTELGVTLPSKATRAQLIELYTANVIPEGAPF